MLSGGVVLRACSAYGVAAARLQPTVVLGGLAASHGGCAFSQSSARCFCSAVARGAASAPGGDNGPAPPANLSKGARADWKTRVAASDAARKAAATQKRQNLRDEWQNLSGRNHSELFRSHGKPYTTPRGLNHAANAIAIPAAARFTCTTLDEQSVDLPDECARHGATLIAVGFNQQAFDYGQQWLDDFTQAYPQSVAAGSSGASRVKCLQLSVISNSLIGALFGSYMTRRFKGTVPAAKHGTIAMLKENAFDHRKLQSTYVRLPPPTAAEEKATNAALKAHKAAEAAAAADPTRAAQSLPAPPAKVRRTAMAAEPGWSIQNPMLLHLFLIDSAGRIRWRAVGPPQGDDTRILRDCTAALLKGE